MRRHDEAGQPYPNCIPLPLLLSEACTHTVNTHLGGGCVTLLADPAVSCLLGGFLQRGVQTPKVIAEPALVTPEAQTGRARVTPHINKSPRLPVMMRPARER